MGDGCEMMVATGEKGIGKFVSKVSITMAVDGCGLSMAGAQPVKQHSNENSMAKSVNDFMLSLSITSNMDVTSIRWRINNKTNTA